MYSTPVCLRKKEQFKSVSDMLDQASKYMELVYSLNKFGEVRYLKTGLETHPCVCISTRVYREPTGYQG